MGHPRRDKAAVSYLAPAFAGIETSLGGNFQVTAGTSGDWSRPDG